MSDWSSYRVRDFLLFSKDTLFEVHEAYNLDYWPWQLLSLLFNCILIAIIIRANRGKLPLLFVLVLVYLSFIWMWVGIVFHRLYFEPINWAAKYFAYAFFVEAFLLLLVGSFASKVHVSPKPFKPWLIGLVILSTWIPFEIFFGRPMTEVLLFGWGPERTALGTLLVTILFRPKKVALLLAVIPLIWSGLSLIMWYSLP